MMRLVDDPNAEAAALIWEQAKQQLSQQSAELDTLRNRAVALLSVAALVAGFFGSRLPHGELHGRELFCVWVALVSFSVSVLLAMFVAAPRYRAWEFTFKLGPLRQRVDDFEAVPVDVTRNLADWADQALSNNVGKMQSMYVMCGLVGVQVIAWVTAAL
jgi:hypothetical protein